MCTHSLCAWLVELKILKEREHRQRTKPHTCVKQNTKPLPRCANKHVPVILRKLGGESLSTEVIDCSVMDDLWPLQLEWNQYRFVWKQVSQTKAASQPCDSYSFVRCIAPLGKCVASYYLMLAELLGIWCTSNAISSNLRKTTIKKSFDRTNKHLPSFIQQREPEYFANFWTMALCGLGSRVPILRGRRYRFVSTLRKWKGWSNK